MRGFHARVAAGAEALCVGWAGRGVAENRAALPVVGGPSLPRKPHLRAGSCDDDARHAHEPRHVVRLRGRRETREVAGTDVRFIQET